MISFTLLYLSSLAYGMCIATTLNPIAWNTSGSTVLVEQISHGPEGGGSLGYRVVDFPQSNNDYFLVSSNFSRGDGKSQESVSASDCRDAIHKTNVVLEKFVFSFRLNEKISSCFAASSRPSLSVEQRDKSLALNNSRAEEIAKSLGLAKKRSLPIATSKDGSHYLLVEANTSCETKCYKVLWENGGAKNLGNCF